MLTPDPISLKVLWKILCLIVHSIIGTPGSSFLVRKGEARRWSYSDWSVLIISTDSSLSCLSLFFLLRLLISCITIEIASYLLSWKLEVDLSRSDVDDSVGCVEELSSKDNRYIFFFFSHVKNHEVSRDIVILYFYHDIFCYSLWKLDWLVRHLFLKPQSLRVRMTVQLIHRCLWGFPWGCKLQTHIYVQQSISINLIIDYLRHDVDTCSEITNSFLENVRPNGNGHDRSSWISLLFQQGIIYPPSHRLLYTVICCIVNIDKICSF